MLKVHRFDAAKLKKMSFRNGAFVSWVQQAFDQKECGAGFEEFRPGERHDYFVSWYDEMFYALNGETECVYRLPPMFDEEQTVRIKAGDLFFMPTGAHYEWRVVGDEPYRQLWVQMPRPKYFDKWTTEE